MLGLCFVNNDEEAQFSVFYGLQYRSTYLLQTLLMICIWLIRGYHFYVDVATIQRDCLLVLAFMAVALQSLSFWKIWQNPDYCSELRKALTFVGDLTLCMIAVLLSGGMGHVPFTTSAIVHSVHGWGSMAGGFRLPAQLLLHLINMECYVLMASQHIAGTGPNGFFRIIGCALGLVIVNSLVPSLINLMYEARQRALFIKKFDLDKQMQPAWAFVLA